jgi:thiol-disulfide isomerase/thioredoxin
MNKKLKIVIWILIICAVVLAAYVFYSKNKPQNPSKTPGIIKTTENQSSQIKTPMVPDFSLKDLNGKTVKLSDYKGKIVMVNFWTVWCKYCNQEIPELDKLDKELEKENDVIILAVDVEESADTVRKYIDSNKIGLKVLLDSKGSVAEIYGVSGFPTTYFVNKDGTSYTFIPEYADKKTIVDILNKMRNGEPAQ